jgi:histidine decarboxylase
LTRELLLRGVVYYSEDTHYSVTKSLRLLQMREIKICSRKNGEMDYGDLRRILKLHQDTPAIIFANICTTMKGAIDNLPVIQKTLEDLAISKHCIHCGAALSGMIPPFVDSAQPFGFDHGADSLSISGHKMIGSLVPCGVVLAKRENVTGIQPAGGCVEYMGVLDTTLTGSRSGFAPLLLWYALTSFSTAEAGELAMKRQVHNALEMAKYAARRLQLAGVPAQRHKNSFTVVFPHPTQAVVRKWQLAPQQEIAHLITVPSVTREQFDAFVRDLSVEHLELQSSERLDI